MNDQYRPKEESGLVINLNERRETRGKTSFFSTNDGDFSNNEESILLHMELVNERCSDDEKKLLMKYADATERGTITRDVLIPADMPLHNLHYAIQRLFGWQNSHLRAFRLDEKD
ncbi:MAG TPA: hypothetical protein VJ990_04425, partial [Clostridia bacterium]|nr:hypothetical protein [Clostridia bacterium]